MPGKRNGGYVAGILSNRRYFETHHGDEASKVAQRVTPPLFGSIQLAILILSKHGLQKLHPHSSNGVRQLCQQLEDVTRVKERVDEGSSGAHSEDQASSSLSSR